MTDAQAAIEAVWRIESPRLIAALARTVHDLGLAEELAQDAFVAALEQWPRDGLPDRPGAWLMQAARRRAIDHLRRADRLRVRQPLLLEEPAAGEFDEEEIRDSLLRLIFTACHPVLAPEARVALTLRVLGGLTTEEIARAFLVPVPTMAQRITRAKRALAEARVPFAVPAGAELAPRLAAVLAVVYLVFNEGYAATAGDDWMRPGLVNDALRLGRMLAELAPGEPEVHSLLALMELQASRMPARLGRAGEPILLLDQDRSRWDRLLIRRGMASLQRARALAGPLGPYGLQAEIAACHARAARPEDTDWERIAALYDALAQVQPSPVVELNRAVAVGMAFGPASGLELIEGLGSDPALRAYPFLHSARGDLLERLGRHDEARSAFERAAEMTQNAADRRLLLERAAGHRQA